MYIPMRPQKKGYSNTKATYAIQLLRSVSNLNCNLKGWGQAIVCDLNPTFTKRTVILIREMFFLYRKYFWKISIYLDEGTHDPKISGSQMYNAPLCSLCQFILESCLGIRQQCQPNCCSWWQPSGWPPSLTPCSQWLSLTALSGAPYMRIASISVNAARPTLHRNALGRSSTLCSGRFLGL